MLLKTLFGRVSTRLFVLNHFVAKPRWSGLSMIRQHESDIIVVYAFDNMASEEYIDCVTNNNKRVTLVNKKK